MIHEHTWNKGKSNMEPCVLFPHIRYTEIYMDRYTPCCACVHTFRSHTLPHHWSQVVTRDSTRRPIYFKTFKLCLYYLLILFFSLKVIATPLPMPLLNMGYNWSNENRNSKRLAWLGKMRNPDEHAYKYSNLCIPETQRCMRQSAPMNKVSILSWSGKTSQLIVLKSSRPDQKSEERLQYDTAHCVNCERMIKTSAIRRPQSIWVLERPWTESDSLTTGLQKFAQNTSV